MKWENAVKKGKKYKYNIYFNDTGNQIEKLIVDSILFYLKINNKE